MPLARIQPLTFVWEARYRCLAGARRAATVFLPSGSSSSLPHSLHPPLPGLAVVVHQQVLEIGRHAGPFTAALLGRARSRRDAECPASERCVQLRLIDE